MLCLLRWSLSDSYKIATILQPSEYPAGNLGRVLWFHQLKGSVVDTGLRYSTAEQEVLNLCCVLIRQELASKGSCNIVSLLDSVSAKGVRRFLVEAAFRRMYANYEVKWVNGEVVLDQ